MYICTYRVGHAEEQVVLPKRDRDIENGQKLDRNY